MRISRFAFSVLLFFSAEMSQAQSSDDLLNLLVKKGTITKSESDSIRSDYRTKQRTFEARQDSFPLSLGRVLNLSGYTQVIYQNFQRPGKFYNGFAIRRARLDLKGTLPISPSVSLMSKRVR
jgi:hypothetical protein